ncbi:unnamed protein product [Rodentolepis nana]|uniref:Protein krueppel n=1 Tax=Rodentolepis nana TaxID=102285 RepID=A0A0R3TI79_RODNA|nr:unnamed protein product [Rodentolepis nana]
MESRRNRITSLTSISNEPLHLTRIVPTPSPTEHSSLGNIPMIDTTKLTANGTAGSHMFPSFTSSIPTLSTNVPDTRDLKDIIYPHVELLTIALEKFKKMPSASTAFVNPFPTSNAQSGSEADVSASFLHGFLSAATERFRSNQKSVESTPSHLGRSHRTRRMRLTEYSCNWCRMTFPKMKYLDKHTKEIHGKYVCQKCKSEFTEFTNLARHGALHTEVPPFECLLCRRKFNRQDHLKRHMDSRHPGYNPARDTRVCGDNAKFLKYTQIAVNNEHEGVETPEVRNPPVDLTSSATQVGDEQMDTSSGVTAAVKTEEKPEDTFA